MSALKRYFLNTKHILEKHMNMQFKGKITSISWGFPDPVGREGIFFIFQTGSSTNQKLVKNENLNKLVSR